VRGSGSSKRNWPDGGGVARGRCGQLRALLLRRTSTADARAVGVGLTHPVETSYGAGFYDQENDATDNWRWARNRAQITLENPLRTPRATTFVARLSSRRPSHVTFARDGRRQEVARTTRLRGARAAFTFTLPSGKHVLTMTGDAPPMRRVAGDTRDLRVQVVDGRIQDAPIAALDP
jgi:hypothetical protein